MQGTDPQMGPIRSEWHSQSDRRKFLEPPLSVKHTEPHGPKPLDIAQQCGIIPFTHLSFFYLYFHPPNSFWVDVYVVLPFPVDVILVLSEWKNIRVSTLVYNDNTYIILFHARIDEHFCCCQDEVIKWKHFPCYWPALYDDNSPITGGFLWQGANNADIGVSLMWICTRC